jgi:sporulation protein YlmC with PRC-barrel domain
MQLKRDSTVFTASGQEVGRVDRVVLDPETKEVTHVVVRKGLFFAQDKVVPIRLIANATETRAILREDAGDLQALPNFEETHFVAGNEPEPGNHSPVANYRPSIIPDALSIPGGGASRASGSAHITQIKENIPEGTVALKEGAKVITSDGKHVGTVEQVHTDPQAGRATHLIISKGVLLKERKRVPADWVSEVKADEIHLSVAAHAIDELGFIP